MPFHDVACMLYTKKLFQGRCIIGCTNLSKQLWRCFSLDFFFNYIYSAKIKRTKYTHCMVCLLCVLEILFYIVMSDYIHARFKSHIFSPFYYFLFSPSYMYHLKRKRITKNKQTMTVMTMTRMVSRILLPGVKRRAWQLLLTKKVIQRMNLKILL